MGFDDNYAGRHRGGHQCGGNRQLRKRRRTVPRGPRFM